MAQQKNQFLSLNMQIRNLLQDIVKNTYEGKVDNQLLEKYCKFYVECSSKQVKTFAGQYKSAEKCIRIVGLERNPKHIVVTSIHELAHHIDHCNRGKSDHSTYFYAEFEKLLYTALNMRVFTPEDVKCIDDVSDGRKVAKMLSEWNPNYINYHNDEKRVNVYNCYDQREILKKRGYRWQADKSWEKSFSIAELKEELNYLNELVGADNIKVSGMNEFEVKVSGFIIAGKGSFEYKDDLKADGFYFDPKKKVWKKSVTENIKEIIKEYSQKYKNIEFKYVMG